MAHTTSTTARWAGGMFVVGSLAYAVAIILYFAVYGQAEGTGPEGTVTLADRVAHLEANWAFARGLWIAEMIAIALIAAAALAFQGEPSSARAARRLSWSSVAVGAIFLLFMYPLMLGGYPEAVRFFEDTPGLLASINSIATFIFFVGNAILFAALGAALYAASIRPAIISRSLGLAGATLGAAGAIGAIAGQAGIGVMRPFALGGIIVMGLCAYLGLVVARGPEIRSAAAHEEPSPKE
jgi:hypothetical protein